ncbi:hypothetical protein BABINDRAFT_6647 [Babjeviella inositovora NRRL Y-12698]|uniref:Tyrosine-protein phosphatase domain-containing protein n=1 Tax=Babjeviella inositovora NRRL Y-12698 TaxID=984486 RepID=A0A1E3QY47_9ASCO|nr:uncharacterized protein BABINDRAFT_6647 [Babjeviella inositovora NRRL Y-12698]ODQ82032.1 hypothetical protein BABINDRAFT_6647 [Babjeviella inositovora NRRL Y-12698]
MSTQNSLIPPLRYCTIQPNLYRGAYPRELNYKFLESLQLKMIISMTPDAITEETDAKFYHWARKNNIRLVHIPSAKSGKGKKRGVPLGYTSIVGAIELILDSDNSPIYLHCLNGGQVTSLAVACLRKLSFWSTVSIFNEFISYASDISVADRSFVESFVAEIHVPKRKVAWIWLGMSRGVVGNHPTLRFYESEVK